MEVFVSKSLVLVKNLSVVRTDFSDISSSNCVTQARMEKQIKGYVIIILSSVTCFCLSSKILKEILEGLKNFGQFLS